MSKDLTSDNPYLSRPTNGPFSPDPTSVLPDQVASYVADSLAENTRRAYLSDLAHFEGWRARASLSEGPVFRPVNRHGRIMSARLSGEAVSLIVKHRIARAGIDPAGHSGHSLRAGLVTSAAQAGVSMFKIKAQTGHSSDAILSRYIRDGELFTENAAGVLL